VERLEDILWSCRNHLRGKADMSDKRDVLLTLVFLKFMSDRFEEQQGKIAAEADRLSREICPALVRRSGAGGLPRRSGGRKTGPAGQSRPEQNRNPAERGRAKKGRDRAGAGRDGGEAWRFG